MCAVALQKASDGLVVGCFDLDCITDAAIVPPGSSQGELADDDAHSPQSGYSLLLSGASEPGVQYILMPSVEHGNGACVT